MLVIIKNLQRWLKEENSFEVISIQPQGIINNEPWANVVLRPYLTDYVTKEDFEIEMEGDEPIYDWHVEREFRGKMTFKGYKIWHPSGRATAFESEFDIIKKVI